MRFTAAQASSVRAASLDPPRRMPPLRILLDQNVPLGLRRALRHRVITRANELGWRGLETGS